METIKEGFLRKNLGLGKEELIKKWLDKYNIKNYAIYNDLTICIYSDVDLTNYPEKELPDYIKFAEVKGKFIIDNSKLTSLMGCPAICKQFNCNNCDNLKSLVGLNCYCEYFYCEHCNRLESLQCDYLSVKYVFKCNNCQNLTSLEGAPKMCKKFTCVECGGNFTKEDVKKVCNAKEIYC